MAVKRESILIAISDPDLGSGLQRALQAAGYSAEICPDRDSVLRQVKDGYPSLVVVSEQVAGESALRITEDVHHLTPVTPVMLVVQHDVPELYRAASRAGVTGFVVTPIKTEEAVRLIEEQLLRARQRKDWTLLESRRVTANLQRRLDELETLARVGQTITGSLELDEVLLSVVDAAVQLTGAEEGNLLLLDEGSGELYMRAQRNFHDEFARTFRLPIQDSLMGSILSTGQPILLNERTPHKIKTSYLVHSLVYVPLQVKGRTFGVLGVDNRERKADFQQRDVKILSALAEYAVIAIENAAVYTTTSLERRRLESLIENIQDAVIVLDQDQRVLILNHTAQGAFGLDATGVVGRKFTDIFSQPELISLVEGAGQSYTNQAEISVADGRTFSAMAAIIPDLGVAVAMHDITYLKKLDRIKSDFVSTVSHDLRSPLTAIMGYVELIERVGPTNDRQREFIHRVHANVQNITALMDDLLNLGHIESGFDTSKETVYMDHVLELALESHSRALTEHDITITRTLPDPMPGLVANPVQMRQLLEKLLDNAIKYNTPEGEIGISLRVEMNQLIIRISDSGSGISALDLPYIFDKFYRGGNSMEISGAGLGLAIVKSIVENHDGRIWVDSTPGKGSTFTVVLPLAG